MKDDTQSISTTNRTCLLYMNKTCKSSPKSIKSAQYKWNPLVHSKVNTVTESRVHEGYREEDNRPPPSVFVSNISHCGLTKHEITK